MVSVERVITVQAPLDTVVDYLKDFARTEEWDPGTVSCTRQDSGPVRMGSSWRNRSQFKGRETELDYELVRLEPAHLTFVGRNKTATSTDDLAFTPGPSADQTVITYRANIEFHGLARLAGPFLRGEFERLGDEVADKMPRVLGALGSA
ncbi:MAG TPA: SRPBCC family protein [Actinocrinis sp.]|nr:SRPBCC family protein [Actinocrinis sp.]